MADGKYIEAKNEFQTNLIAAYESLCGFSGENPGEAKPFLDNARAAYGLALKANPEAVNLLRPNLAKLERKMGISQTL